MQTFLIVLIILASIVLSFLVLIQNPKGGGLSSGFSGGTNLMGVKRTGDLLEKGTWGFIIAIIVFSLAINIMGPSTGSSKSGLGGQIEVPAQANPLNLNPATQQTAPQQAAPTTTGDSTK